MSINGNIKTIFVLNYIILFSGITFSLYYAHYLFIDLKEKSAYKDLLTINKLMAKNVNSHLEHVANSVEALGKVYKKLYLNQYEYIDSEPKNKHDIIKNDKITFYKDYGNENDFAFKSDHVSIILSNLNQNTQTVALELNLFHQLTPALESIHNTFNFSWVYFTTVNDFMLIYPYVPFAEADEIYKPTHQHFYNAADFATKSVGWEEPYSDLVGDGILVTASYPVYDDKDVLLGVASHDITVDEMAKSILKNANIYEENVAFLLSKKGKVISSNSQQFMKEIQEQSKEGYRGDFYYRTLLNADKDNIKNITVSNYDYLNKLGDEIISKIEHTKNVSTQRWKSSIPFFDDKLLFVSQIPASAWTLVYYVPKKSILSKAQSIFYETLFILAIFITLLFVVSAFLTMRHLITPLDIINKASQRFGDGFTDVEVQYSNQNLLKILFHTFNTMVKKVNFNQQLLEKKVSERTKELQEEITLRKTVEDELRLISRTDTMTGIWNRGYFFEMLEREINRSHRFNSNMTLLMIDIDFFKNINDTYGHNVGDKAIKHLTKLISLSIRKENIFGRLGGEEFGIILIETEEPDTHRNIAERIRKSVENNPLIINNTPLSITISVGISTLRNDDNTNTLYIRSDEALYLAKEKGRNRIEEV